MGKDRYSRPHREHKPSVRNETEQFIDRHMESLGVLLKEEVSKMCAEFYQRLDEIRAKMADYDRLQKAIAADEHARRSHRLSEQRRRQRLAEKKRFEAEKHG